MCRTVGDTLSGEDVMPFRVKSHYYRMVSFQSERAKCAKNLPSGVDRQPAMWKENAAM